MSTEIKKVSYDTILNGRSYRGTASVTVMGTGAEPEYFGLDLDALGVPRQELTRSVFYEYQGREVELGNVGNLLRACILYNAGARGYELDCVTGLYFWHTSLVLLHSGTKKSFKDFTFRYEGEYYLFEEGDCVYFRNWEGIIRRWVPTLELGEYCYCEHCASYVAYSDYLGDEEGCAFCAEEKREKIIEGYTASHDHNNAPLFFGEYKGTFAGMGFELEVDSREYISEATNNRVASELISTCGLEEGEVRFAHDGSLNNGFECISEPHTIKEFWRKAPQWTRMLEYLSKNGYSSHDVGTCGLHVHVSREMFGKTEAEQASAIAKVMVFFDENWEDCKCLSRRRNFSYCEKNECLKEGTSNYYCWKKSASRQKGHYVALNNGNSHTFEYRLGRGTLNAWSFFSWIDFVLTITKNSKRLTISKVNTNDRISWLAGIKESTAKYMFKRGAFVNEVLELFPNIEWENDLTTDNIEE